MIDATARDASPVFAAFGDPAGELDAPAIKRAFAGVSGRLLGGNGYGVRRRRKVPTGHQSPQGGYRPARLRPQGQPEPVMANAAASGDPVDRVNRLVERLAGW